jgi:hypothetical protein
MPYCWKTEYYVIKDDDAIEWCDTYKEALDAAKGFDADRIEKVKHYSDDHETIWEKNGEDA